MTDRVDTIHFLARPDTSGRRAAALRSAIATAEELGFDPVVLTAPTAGEVADVVRAALPELARLVVVGGDGLLHHALPALVGFPAIVGIVPSGTGNDFARALGIRHPSRLRPGDDPRRVACLAPGTPVDVLVADDGRCAATVITGGFSGRVNQMANGMRFPPGQSKYTVATLSEVRRLEPIRLRITTPDEQIDTASAFFAVANGRYFGGGMAICPDADPTDGLLDIAIVGDVSAPQLLGVLPLVFSGRHVRHPAVRTLRAEWVEIVTDEPLWADGEPFGQAPVRLRAAPNSLLVARSID